ILWDRAVYGPHRLRLWVSTAAGQPDGNAANDSLTTTLHVASREVPRWVVQELATSSTCPPCAVHDDSLRSNDRRHPERRVERIAYPMNFPGSGDPYYLPEFRARAVANRANMRNYPNLLLPLAAPMMYANGYAFVDATDRFLVPLRPRYDSTMRVLLAPPTYLQLSGTCRVSGDSIRGTVTLTPTRFLPGRSHTLRLVVTERRTTGNARTNGQTEFRDVAKKIILNRILAADLLPEQPLTIPYRYFFGPGHTVEHFDSLEVVAFVQYSQAAGTSPSEVIQVTRLRPGAPLGLPVTAVASAPGLTVELAPNPSRGATVLHLLLGKAQPVDVLVTDLLGRVALRLPTRSVAAGARVLPLDLTSAAPGVYVVRVRTEGRTTIRRLVLTAR
ncbi:MAG: T9SS type A sorting domain-containing protein, partial [Hymenobacteraceae bacterium]|nr:T9SS type A sorting domain-containing protein [Hymenobacteraceae bacterium]